MGGRGSKGRARTPQEIPEDPERGEELPPWLERMLARQGEQPESPPEHAGEPRAADRSTADKPNPYKHIPGVKPPANPGPVPRTDAEIDAHVVETARSFETSPGDYINLANVRAALHPDLDRASVDAALQRLNRTRRAVIVPDDDQAAMTQPERDAAISIGNQPKHLIAFDDHH